MKNKLIRVSAAALMLSGLCLSGLQAQEPAAPAGPDGAGRQRVVTPAATPDPAQQPPATAVPAADPQKDGAPPKLPGDVPDDIRSNRQGQPSEEEAAVVPYYNNFLTTYYLGPEDVISVTVFGQDRYSRSGITIPPNGRISYPLIAEGIFVAGRTTEQVAAEITRKLDEYIIDPKVTVFLDKAVSARYSVLGDVSQPGMRIMTRRLSVYEAVAEAGGVLRTGDKSKVVILRRKADGSFDPILVNLKLIERGQATEMAFLVPGDQVVVPGNKIKVWEKLLSYVSVIGFARTFATGGL
jgi:polysaccharide export outer membrane protein